MRHGPGLVQLSLKRGALLAAANWPVVAVQFAASTVFKALLAIPMAGGALLAFVLAGQRALNPVDTGIERWSGIVAALIDQPVALAAFLAAFGIAVLGGSVFMFLVKGGTVSVLAAGDRAAGEIERGPWGLDGLWHAAAFSPERFIEGSGRLFRRYLRLGIGLIAVYAASAAFYLAIVFGYRPVAPVAPLVGWALVTLVSGGFVLWITIVNLFYLLAQLAVAVDDTGVRAGLRLAWRFAWADLRAVARLFAIVLLLVVLTSAVALLAAAGLSLVAFVPLVGVVVWLPIQIVAWLVRGLVFEYLGLAALGAYLRLYRTSPAAGDATGSVSEVPVSA